MVTIGSDCHLKTSTMTVLDNNGEKIMRSKLDNDPEVILKFVRQFSHPKQFAIETCYNWPAVYELLKDEVDEFHLLHAKKLKSIVESQSKCDNNAADEIAHLTHVGFIPKSYIASAPARQLRRLLRTRINISTEITRNKNRIHAIINSSTFYCQRPKNFKDLFCKRGLEYLKQIPFSPQEQFLVTNLLREIQSLNELKTQFDEYVETLNFHSDDLKYLQTAPAMNGKLFKYILLAEIDNINRFKNSGSLVAYAGLIPKDNSSGEKIRKGHLRTDCNKFLKWAIIEAAIPAMRKDPGLRELYKITKQRTNTSSAKIAVARTLLKSIYHILKERRPYYSAKPRIAPFVSLSSQA